MYWSEKRAKRIRKYRWQVGRWLQKEGMTKKAGDAPAFADSGFLIITRFFQLSQFFTASSTGEVNREM